MSEFSLIANKRDVHGKALKVARESGRIPAVVYGHGVPTRSIEVAGLPFQKVLQSAGESTLIDLVVGGQEPVKVIIQDVRYEPKGGKILHVDFYQVRMTEKIEVDVVLHFSGESPAVKELGGTFVKDRADLTVSCLPNDLVKEIDVDISVLKTFEDVLRVRDLALPKGLTVLKAHDEDPVAHVEAPRTEAELAELDTAVEEDVTKVEKIEKPEKEEETDVAATPEAAPKEKEKKE